MYDERLICYTVYYCPARSRSAHSGCLAAATPQPSRLIRRSLQRARQAPVSFWGEYPNHIAVRSRGHRREVLPDGQFGSNVRRAVLRLHPATNRWTPKPILGRARTGAATAVLGGKLYVMGGYLEGPPWTHERLDITSVFNPTTNLWSQRARLPSPRDGIAGTTVMLNGTSRIEVIGGPAPGNNLQYIP